jgi:hypothetical protein
MRIISIIFQNESGAYSVYLKEDQVLEILNCNCLDGDYGKMNGEVYNPKKEIIQTLKLTHGTNGND